jgi:hypothetical protein
MVPANRKNAKPAKQIEISRAITIKEVLPLSLLKADVVADRLEHAHKLFIEVTRVHGTPLRLPVHKHLGNV